MRRVVLLVLAGVLAGFGAYLAHDETFTGLMLALAAPALVAAVLPARRYWLLPTLGSAAWLVGYATWDSLVDLADGILFWWPAFLAVAAVLVSLRRPVTPP